MAKEQAPPAAEEKPVEKKGSKFLYRVVKWPRRQGDKKALKPNAVAYGMAWVHGHEYGSITQIKGVVDGANVTAEKVVTELSPKLCEKIKAKIEKQFSGPAFEQGMEVKFTAIAE